jgi:hypothetical protein
MFLDALGFIRPGRNTSPALEGALPPFPAGAARLSPAEARLGISSARLARARRRTAGLECGCGFWPGGLSQTRVHWPVSLDLPGTRVIISPGARSLPGVSLQARFHPWPASGINGALCSSTLVLHCRSLACTLAWWIACGLALHLALGCGAVANSIPNTCVGNLGDDPPHPRLRHQAMAARGAPRPQSFKCRILSTSGRTQEPRCSWHRILCPLSAALSPRCVELCRFAPAPLGGTRFRASWLGTARVGHSLPGLARVGGARMAKGCAWRT